MSRAEELSKRNFFDELMALRDEQRELQKKAIMVVKGKDLPQEINRQGVMKWYMHPMINDTVIKSLIIHSQEIPSGSKSGKQKYQGGIVIFFLKGQGYTTIDGVKHQWKKGDCLNIPLRVDGVIVQHFNGDPDNPAEFVQCEPNVVDSLFVDRGSGFEQIENCPEYEQQN